MVRSFSLRTQTLGRLDSVTQVRDVQHVDGFWAPIFCLVVFIVVLIKIYLYEWFYL